MTLKKEQRRAIAIKALQVMVKYPEFRERVEMKHPKFAKIVEPLLSNVNIDN